MYKITNTSNNIFTNIISGIVKNKSTNIDHSYNNYYRSIQNHVNEQKVRTDGNFEYIMDRVSPSESFKMENAILNKQSASLIKNQITSRKHYFEQQIERLRFLKENVVNILEEELSHPIMDNNLEMLHHTVKESKNQFINQISLKYDGSNVFVFGGLTNNNPLNSTENNKIILNKTIEDKNILRIHGVDLRQNFLFASDSHITKIVAMLNEMIDIESLQNTVEQDGLKQYVSSLHEINREMEITIKKINKEIKQLDTVEYKTDNIVTLSNDLVQSKLHQEMQLVNNIFNSGNDLIIKQSLRKQLHDIQIQIIK